MSKDIETQTKQNSAKDIKNKVEKYPRHTLKIIKGTFAASEAARLCRVGFIRSAARRSAARPCG